MGFYQQLKHTWENEDPKIARERLISLRKDPVITRVERPTKLHRARALGYKAKPGIIVVRIKVSKSHRMRPKIRAGRRSKHFRHVKVVSKSYQWIAEERVNRRFTNCEVLNSYLVAKDGKHYWYEVIMLDKNHPVIKSDPHFSWVAEPQHTGRVFRGLTRAGRKARGLLDKSRGSEKASK